MLIAALVAAAALLASIVGAWVGAVRVRWLMLALLLLVATAQLVALLNPKIRLARYHVVLRHLRVAPFERASPEGGALLVRLARRRFAELHARLRSPFATFGNDRATLSLVMLGLLAMVLGTSAGDLMSDAAIDRFMETIDAMDRRSPSFAADERAAMAELQRARALESRLSSGGFVGWIALVSAAIGRGEWVRRRTLGRLHSLRCPDCGYGLRGAPPGVAPELLKGLPTGPAACPECGAPWPLIPPPTHQEVLNHAAWRAPAKRRGRR